MPTERQPKPEPPSSAMKVVAIIAILVAAALGYSLFKAKSATEAATQAAATNSLAHSNLVLELTTKLALEKGTAALAVSNLQHTIDRRTADLLGFSNRLVQANLILATTHKELAAAQSVVQVKFTEAGLLQAQRDELTRQAQVIPALQIQIAALQERLDSLTGDRELLVAEVRRLEVERNELNRQLHDPNFLRLQTEKAEEEAELRRRAVSARPGAPADPRSRLELLPDGSVKLAPPSAPQAKR